jgi:hypothetical protein
MNMIRDMHRVILMKGGQEFGTLLVSNGYLKVCEKGHGKGVEILERTMWDFNIPLGC